jgi:uncharacterized YigZ family protein
MDFLVPSKYGEAEYTEKRSRFIGQVWSVESEPEARELIARAKSKYYDARHNCWCYIIRDGKKSGLAAVRYADDGEPQGTAGQPMLEVFQRGGIENVLCVVTRYFGGILLGAGGLTRAYAHTAKLALDAAGIAEMRHLAIMGIACPYNLFDRIKSEIDASGGSVESVEYAADISIRAHFSEKEALSFAGRLTEITAGTVAGQITGYTYAAVPVK